VISFKAGDQAGHFLAGGIFAGSQLGKGRVLMKGDAAYDK